MNYSPNYENLNAIIPLDRSGCPAVPHRTLPRAHRTLAGLKRQIGQVAEYSDQSYSLPKPTFRHARTDFQSASESLPIKRTSRCGKVIGNSLKYDAACSPACCQSANSQSVGAIGWGACVVITPTTTHDGGPRLCQFCPRKGSHDDVAGPQRSARSSSSKRRSAAALASARSSSVQESDHSMVR